ncbi:tRNA wybutosine-synthesizing protein 5 [Trichinella sp. T6]|nr:tRNA wybutosine-synthesizing protein 5 [Trichinella sp. T6]
MTTKQLPVYTYPAIPNLIKFLINLFYEREAFIIRGIDIGKCTALWSSVEYLKSKIPDEVNVSVHVSTNPKLNFLRRNFEYKILKLKAIVERCSRNEQTEFFLSKDEKYYMRALGSDHRKDAACIQTDFPYLMPDLQLPFLFDKDKIFSSVLRISSADIQIWTHYDIMDNILLQIVGRKRVVLFDPSQIPYLYLEGDKSKVIDIDDLESTEFPQFQRAVRNEGMLYPGDVLYIPALWFHNTTAVDFSISVNIFWQHLDNSFYDKKDLYGNRDLILAQKAFQCFDQGAKLLEKLPSPYRQFYFSRSLQNRGNLHTNIPVIIIICISEMVMVRIFADDTIDSTIHNFECKTVGELKQSCQKIVPLDEKITEFVAIYCGNTLSDDKELTEENGIYSWSIIKLLSRVKEPSAETLVLRKGECLSISRSFRTMSIYNLTTTLEKVSSVHRKMMADAQCARRFLTVVPQLKQDSLAWAALRDWMLMSFFLKSENVFSIGDTHPAFISAVYAMSSTLLERVGKRSTPLKGITFSLQRIDENQPDIQYEPGIAQLLRAHNLARGLYRQNILQSPHRRANQNRQSTPPNTNQQSVTGSQQFTRDLLSDALRQARERTFEMEMLRDLGFHNDEENAHFLEVSNENNEKMDRTGNHQETFNEVARKKLKLDDDQLNDYEKQVKPNADIEETSQDEQAMEANAENNYSNSVIGNESELMTVSGSRQRSMLDEEKKVGESVRNINADKVNEGVFEGSSDGNGQSSSRNEAQVMYDTACETTNEQADENMDESENGVLGGEIDSDREVPHICPTFLLLWSMRGTPCFNTLLMDFLEMISDSSEECEEP